MEQGLEASRPPNYSGRRTHGCSDKKGPFQIISYVIVLASIVIYFSCINVLFRSDWLLILCMSSLIALIVSAAAATFTDPTDRVVYTSKWANFDRTKHFRNHILLHRYCDHCQSFCDVTSKHCRLCDRCVYKFDHHCQWFNNCVGARNYKAFFISLLAGVSYCTCFITHCVLASIEYPSHLSKIIPSWIMGAVLSIFGLLLLNLMLLHIYLTFRNISTYAFLTGNTVQNNPKQGNNEELNKNQESMANVIPVSIHPREQSGKRESNLRSSEGESTDKMSDNHSLKLDESNGNNKKQSRRIKTSLQLRHMRSLKWLLQQTEVISPKKTDKDDK